jgi:hypothetical protein
LMMRLLHAAKVGLGMSRCHPISALSVPCHRSGLGAE